MVSELQLLSEMSGDEKVQVAVTLETVSDVDVMELSKYAKKNDKLFMAYMEKNVVNTMLFSLFIHRFNMISYCIMENVQLSKGFTPIEDNHDGNNIRLAIKALCHKRTIPIAVYHITSILDRYKEWDMDNIFLGYINLID